MKKKKKAAARELATIAAEIRETYRNDTGNVIKRGNLLMEAKAQVKHGEWLSWLDGNFSMDARTAQRAMAAAKFAAKYDCVSYLNLSVEALYELSAGDYSAKVVKAVINEAKTKPVSAQRVSDIEESFAPKPKTVEEIQAQTTAEGDAEEQREAEGQAEAEKTLDGAPPDLPPPAPPEKPDPDRLICDELTRVVLQLKKLRTAKGGLARFAGCKDKLTQDDLAYVTAFLEELKPIIGTKGQPAQKVFIEQRKEEMAESAEAS